MLIPEECGPGTDTHKTKRDTENDALRARSGNVHTNDSVVAFLYEVIRDFVPIGMVERIAQNSLNSNGYSLTNGWLAMYCKDVVDRLRAASH